MTIEIKPFNQLKYLEMWYDEISGNEFEAWENPNFPGLYFVAEGLWIPQIDVIVK